MTHPPLLKLLPFVAAVALIASPAFAQRLPEPWADSEDRPPRVDLSVSTGVFASTDWSNLVLLGTLSSATGVFEQVLLREIRVNPNNEFDAAVTYWRGRYGLRFQGGFSESSLVIGGPFFGVNPQFTTDGLRIGLDTWSFDMRGLIGWVDYKPRRWIWPYGYFGFGAIAYDLAQSVPPSLVTFIEGAPSTTNIDKLVVIQNSRDFLLALDELGFETVFAFNFGAGTDIKIPLGPAAIGIRLDVSDSIAPSPVSLRISELRRFQPLASNTEIAFKLVHNFRAAAGLVVQIGR